MNDQSIPRDQYEDGQQHKMQEKRAGFKLLSYDEMINMPEPNWLVEGVIQQRSAGLMYGSSNTFKSFLMIDLALSVATGNSWHGHEVKQGKVLIVATEGANGVGRLLAFLAGLLNIVAVWIGANRLAFLLSYQPCFTGWTCSFCMIAKREETTASECADSA